MNTITATSVTTGASVSSTTGNVYLWPPTNNWHGTPVTAPVPTITTGTTTPYNTSPWVMNQGATTTGLNWSNISPHLQVQGDAEFHGNIKFKGRDLTEMFEKIDQRLAILHPNEKLEEKWEKLRELRQAYMDLEKEIIEKEKMWAILKE
jgi:hypothetical protein